MGAVSLTAMEVQDETPKQEASQSPKRVRRTARKSTHGWKPEQCIYSHDHNGEMFFHRSSALSEEPLLLNWTRQHYDVARVLIGRMTWTSRRKLASSSIELRRTVDRARKDGKCNARFLLEMRKVEPAAVQPAAMQALAAFSAGLGNTMQAVARDPASKEPLATTTVKGPAALQRYACAPLGGKLYLAGGHDYNRYVASLHVLDLGSGLWTAAAPMTIARDGHSCTALDGNIYVVGGRSGIHRLLKSVEMYDPETGIWSSIAPLHTPRRGHRCSVMGGKLQVSGGKDAAGRLMTTFQNEVYDPNANVWSQQSITAPCEQSPDHLIVCDYKERPFGA